MPMKGAIVGFGNIAVNGHLPGYRTHSDIVISAVMDVMPQASEKCADILPHAAFYNDLDTLLADQDVDFVDIATPPGTHADNILKALKHDRHVLCEKPLVLNSIDYREIAELSREKECVVYTVHNWRHAPIFQEVSRLVSCGSVGMVREIEYRVIRTRPSISAGETGVEDNWRIDPEIAGGGILVDHGWHAFYMVNQWTERYPQWVECTLDNRKFKNIPLEDTAEVLIGYDGAEARLLFTWAGEKRKNTVLITGDRGSIFVNDDTITIETPEETRDIRFHEALSRGSHHPEWYSAIMADFVEEIRNPARAGQNFREAGWCQIMMEKCAESSRKKRREILSTPHQPGKNR